MTKSSAASCSSKSSGRRCARNPTRIPANALKQIEKELSALARAIERLKAHWQTEKDAIGRIRKLKEEIERLKAEEQRYERAGDLSSVAEIRYGKLSAAEKELKAAQDKLGELQKDHPMLKEEVGEEEIAKIVSKWTGIPVGRLLEGEVQKLVHMEERLRAARGRPGRGAGQRGQRDSPQPFGA